MSGEQPGESNVTVNNLKKLVTELEDQTVQLRNEIDIINAKLLIQRQIALDSNEEYEFKIKELTERISYLQNKLEDKESILQFKEKKWSEFESVVNKFVRINP